MGDKTSGISQAVNWKRKTVFDQDLITLIKPAVARPVRGITRILCRVPVVVAHAAEVQGAVLDSHLAQRNTTTIIAPGFYSNFE